MAYSSLFGPIFYGNLVGLMMFLSVGRATTLGVTDGAGLTTFVGLLALMSTLHCGT